MRTLASIELTAVRDWIVASNEEASPSDIDIDTDLIESRLIDSMAFAEFLFVLEDLCGKPIPLDDLDLDVFRTLRSIQSHFFGVPEGAHEESHCTG